MGELRAAAPTQTRARPRASAREGGVSTAPQWRATASGQDATLGKKFQLATFPVRAIAAATVAPPLSVLDACAPARHGIGPCALPRFSRPPLLDGSWRDMPYRLAACSTLRAAQRLRPWHALPHRWRWLGHGSRGPTR